MENVWNNSIEEWRWFLKHSAPGCRFRDRYRRQQTGRDRSMLGRACYVSFGIVIAIASLVLAPLPGPGLGTFLLAVDAKALEEAPGFERDHWPTHAQPLSGAGK